MPLWELQIDSTKGAGWKGWRVELTQEGKTTFFAYDERDGATTPEQALEMALESEPGQEILEAGPYETELVEIRTVISAEINPN